jgi:hypothetical protein
MTLNAAHLLADCTSSLFCSYAVVLQRALDMLPAAPHPRDLALTAGLVELHAATSAERSSVAGKVLLLGSFDFIASTYPKQDRTHPFSITSAGDLLYVRDWTRELTNQLAGRITNQLAADGARMSPGPPRSLAADAAVREMKLIGGSQLHFTVGSSHVYVALYLPDFRYQERGTSIAPDVAAPGSITLFDKATDD